MDIADMITRFDHHDPVIMADPAAAYRRFRNECPVGWSNVHQGFWVVSRYDDVLHAAGDAEQYCSGQGIAIPGTSTGARIEPQEADGPRHAQIRKQMNAWFARGPVLAMRPAIEDLSASLLEQCRTRITFDLAIDYAVPLASLTMLRVLGIPIEYEGRLRKNLDVLLHARTAEESVVFGSYIELYECISEVLVGKQKGAEGNPGAEDDLINKIMAVEIDGTPTTVAEQVSMILSLVLAGLETSALAIASTAACLIDQPELRDRLIADPRQIPKAIDEFLRFISPVQAIGRRVTSQAQLGERTLNGGDQVLLLYGSANRDPAIFNEPDEIVLDRHPNRHVTFGYGVHRCLGHHVARLELDVALRDMLGLLPALAPQGRVEWSFGENRGIRSLPVTLVHEASDAVREHRGFRRESLDEG
jgi:cytochrome P450